MFLWWDLFHFFLFSLLIKNPVVPYNQPIAAMDLLNRFLRNESFVDLPSPTIRFKKPASSSSSLWSSLMGSGTSNSNSNEPFSSIVYGSSNYNSNYYHSSSIARGGSLSSSAIGGPIVVTKVALSCAFFAGIIFTLIINKLWNKSRRVGERVKRYNYSRIPDTASSDM